MPPSRLLPTAAAADSEAAGRSPASLLRVETFALDGAIMRAFAPAVLVLLTACLVQGALGASTLVVAPTSMAAVREH
ncbi:hypothetical protein WJX73_008704 [Symbiochloris irregularis]|uniref:MFS transporter n=1 Tax=Symbiochloris irregularis TaxID=706552 RepID=A0AAW1NLF5_9CHLO